MDKTNILKKECKFIPIIRIIIRIIGRFMFLVLIINIVVFSFVVVWGAIETQKKLKEGMQICRELGYVGEIQSEPLEIRCKLKEYYNDYAYKEVYVNIDFEKYKEENWK